MILSTSNKKVLKQGMLRYALLALFCLIFSIIYEHFSHGVYSTYMTKMFLIPAIGGTGVYFLCYQFLHDIPPLIIRQLYGCGICTLTLGSCITGIIDIYGTQSDLTIIYGVVGIAFIISAFIAGLLYFLKIHLIPHQK